MANTSTGWRKSYDTVNLKRRQKPSTPSSNNSASLGQQEQSWLGNYYQGSYDRLSRYVQYDHMDYDVDVNLALDTTAEFCTLLNEDSALRAPFKLNINESVDNSTANLLHHALKSWCKLNEWNSRIFESFRNTLKYGDNIFIRDPDTFKLHWVDIANVTKVLVNEYEGKEPEYYFIKNISPNLEAMVATESSNLLHNVPFTNNSYGYGGSSGGSSYSDSFGTYNSIPQNKMKEYPVDATNIVHISLSNGMDMLWPFGRSILDSSFKPFKQKELLEDAIIIYRVQRSPERLVFNIDTGDMNPKKAKQYLEESAKGLRQKRIPVIDRGNGQTVMDTTYNPMSMTEDYFFSKSADGRGTTVESLPGGESTGSIDDLKFFTSRLVRSLRVPMSYMAYPSDDVEGGGGGTYNDGKIGTAYMEEFKFSQYCERLQRQVIKPLNREFKLFVKSKDIEISASDFDIEFMEPQSFGDYRQIEKDTAQLTVFQSVSDVSYLSKRFIMERYMGMSQDEIKRNERLWMEEKNISIDLGSTTVGESGVNIVSDDDVDDIEASEDSDDENADNGGGDDDLNFDDGDEDQQ